jgi:hypothetical protein
MRLGGMCVIPGRREMASWGREGHVERRKKLGRQIRGAWRQACVFSRDSHITWAHPPRLARHARTFADGALDMPALVPVAFHPWPYDASPRDIPLVGYHPLVGCPWRGRAPLSHAFGAAVAWVNGRTPLVTHCDVRNTRICPAERHGV